MVTNGRKNLIIYWRNKYNARDTLIQKLCKLYLKLISILFVYSLNENNYVKSQYS